MTDTFEIDTFELNTVCDGMGELLNTARHNGFKRTDAEIREHIRECRECFDVNGEFLD